MEQIEIEARALILKFMMPIDGLHKYPMCFDTAKQCAIIHCNEILMFDLRTKSESQFVIERRIDEHFTELKETLEKL